MPLRSRGGRPYSHRGRRCGPREMLPYQPLGASWRGSSRRRSFGPRIPRGAGPSGRQHCRGHAYRDDVRDGTVHEYQHSPAGPHTAPRKQKHERSPRHRDHFFEGVRVGKGRRLCYSARTASRLGRCWPRHMRSLPPGLRSSDPANTASTGRSDSADTRRARSWAVTVSYYVEMGCARMQAGRQHRGEGHRLPPARSGCGASAVGGKTRSQSCGGRA